MYIYFFVSLFTHLFIISRIGEIKEYRDTGPDDPSFPLPVSFLLKDVLLCQDGRGEGRVLID